MREPSPATETDLPIGQRQIDVVRLAAALLVATIIIAALYFGQVVLIPLAMAFLISFVLSPLVQWLVRQGLSRLLAVSLTMALVLAVLAGLGTLVTAQVRTLSAELPRYQTTIREKIQDLGARMERPGMLDGVIQTVDTVQEEAAEAVGSSTETVVAPQRVRVIPEPVSPFKTAILWLSPLLAPIANAGIVLVFVVLILLDQGDLRDRLLRLLGGNLFRSTDALEEASKRISKYLLMQLVVNVSYAVPMALGLWAIGVPGWILWGTLAAVMRFIPYVGPMLSAIFPLSLAFAVDPGWNMVLMTAALIVFLELISNNVVEPLLYGTSTGLSVLSLIAAATFWTAIWGPVGLVLSTPLTVCLLVVGRYIPQLSILETLLGTSPALDRQTRLYQRLIADDPDEAFEIAEAAIADSSVAEFYNAEGMEVLRQASADYLDNARTEHRLRIASGIDDLLEQVRDDHPAPTVEGPAPVVACIAGKWEVDRHACEMLAHSLALEGIPATVRAPGSITARYVDGLNLEGVKVAILSFFSREPDPAARKLVRRIRARWPDVSIVLGFWGVSTEEINDDRRDALGADFIVASISEATGRVTRLLQTDDNGSAEIARPQTEVVTGSLGNLDFHDAELREDLNDFALRAADVFDVHAAVIIGFETPQELLIGASRDLPGTRELDDRGLPVLPLDAPLGPALLVDHRPVMVPDIDRDPYLSESSLLRAWSGRSLAAALIRQGDGAVLGALCLVHDEAHELDEEELRLLETMAAEIAERLTGRDPAPVSEPPRPLSSATVGQHVPD